ncbi:MAG: hypothetical protein ACOYBD_01165 [Bilifractor sp.]|jgi:ribose transport system ATP-binding protein
MKNDILRLNNILQYKHDLLTLNYCSMEIEHSEIFGILVLERRGLQDMIQLIRYNSEISYGYVEYEHKIVNTPNKRRSHENKIYLISTTSNLIDNSTITENFSIGSIPNLSIFYNKNKINRMLNDYFLEYQISISPDKLILQLSPLDKLKIEVMKAVVYDYHLIILDNPAAELGESDIEDFHSFIKTVSDHGYTFIYICFHHEQLKKICDHIAIYEHGHIGKVYQDYTRLSMDARIFGRAIYNNIKRQNSPMAAICQDQFVIYQEESGKRYFANSGEIVLYYGEGIRALRSLAYKITSFNNNRIIIDRSQSGKQLFPEMSYIDNLCFYLGEKKRSFWLRHRYKKSIRNEYRDIIGPIIDKEDLYDISETDKLNLLFYSIILARPEVAVFVSPLSRLDIPHRSTAIHLLQKCRAKGITIVILSTELYDLLYISDRLLFEKDGTLFEYRPDNYDKIPGVLPGIYSD